MERVIRRRGIDEESHLEEDKIEGEPDGDDQGEGEQPLAEESVQVVGR